MKIIFLEAVQNLGGARKSTIELAKRCQEQGHDVLIVDFWGSCQPFVELVEKNELNIKFLDKRDLPVIITSSNKFKFLINCFFYLFYMIRLKKRFRNIVENFNPDIVSLNSDKCLSIVPRNGNFKIHFVARGWFNSLPLKTKYIFKKYKDMVFFTVSQATRQAVYTGGLAKLENIHLLTTAIDFAIIDKVKEQSNFLPWDKSKQRPFVMHHCGGFLKTKGQHISLEIAKKLKENNIAFKLYFTGIIYKGDISDKYYNSFLKKIDEYKLTDEIEIIINSQEVLNYFCNSDILLFPTYTEGLPRVALEAMAFGKPVIANPAGGVIDLVINNYTGYVAEFNDVDDYYNKIVKLIENKDDYARISQNAISMIKNTYAPSSQIECLSKFCK